MRFFSLPGLTAASRLRVGAIDYLAQRELANSALVALHLPTSRVQN
jgi:hypothetical protein